MSTRIHLIAGILLCCSAARHAEAYPTSLWLFETLARAPVIATCVVEEIKLGSPPIGAERPIVQAHAILRVLRSFPPSAFSAGARIHLDYEALAEKGPTINGPDVAQIKLGDTLALPLKTNTRPSSASWRLIGDEGQGLVIPAIVRNPPFARSAPNGRTFLLREIASTLLAGTRPELLAESHSISGQLLYTTTQKALAPDLMALLQSKLKSDDRRWPSIAASLLSSMGLPRPGVASLRAGKDTIGGNYFTGSLVTAVLQELGPSQQAEDALIHQLLVNSDIASWGVGVTLTEFAQKPNLVAELRKLMQARYPGALMVSGSILRAGQKEILEDAMTLAFYYVLTPKAKHSEFPEACRMIRDYGDDEQFDRLLSEIRNSQYRDIHRYNQLWGNLLQSTNSARERLVLNILLEDRRIDPELHVRYSDRARQELTGFQTQKQ